MMQGTMSMLALIDDKLRVLMHNWQCCCSCTTPGL
jgi:hypothetical protein